MRREKESPEETELWNMIPKQLKKDRGETYFRLSLIAFEKAQYGNSLALAENACDCFKENCDEVGLANAQTAVAFNLYEMKQTREAIRALVRAVLGYAKTEDDQEWQYREHLARWFKEVEDFELARIQIQKIVDHCKEQLDEYGTAYFQFLLGQASCDLDMCEQAIEEYKESRQLYKNLKEPRDVAEIDLYMARCYNHLKNCFDAQTCATRAVGVFELIKELVKTSQSYSQLGRALNCQGEFERALSAYEKAHRLIIERAPINFHGLNLILNGKSKALKGLGRADEAELIDRSNRVIAETLGIEA
jgi:tetratricopeptide (TPR) repeat protein